MPPSDPGPERVTPPPEPEPDPSSETLPAGDRTDAPLDEPVTSAAGVAYVPVRSRHGLVGPFTGRQLLTAIAVVAAVAVGLVVITRPIGNPSSVGRTGGNPAPTAYIVGPAVEGLHVGDLAPELVTGSSNGSPTLLTDLDGKPISLAALRGHPVWLDFWASWCPPCQDELPVLRDLQRSYQDRGLVIVAVSVQETNAADVRAYAQRYQLNYTIGTDLTGAVFRRYKVYALPTQFFIDRNGIIRSVVQGPVDYTSAVTNLEAIVAATADGSASAASPAPAAPTPSAPPLSGLVLPLVAWPSRRAWIPYARAS